MMRLRLLCTVLVLMAFISVYAVRAAFSPRVGACYVTDGDVIETTFLGSTDAYYPVATEATVEEVEGGFVTTHRVRFEDRRMRVYLGMVVR